jgi:hypothetical protein
VKTESRAQGPALRRSTAATIEDEATERAVTVNGQDARGTPSVTGSCPCGRSIRWMRTDAKFCSNACRQRAYRERKAVPT